MNNFLKKVKSNLEIEKIKFDRVTFLAGDASTRKYFSIIQKQQNNILMCDFQNPSIVNKFEKTNRLFFNAGIRVPKIIKKMPNTGMMILENFGKSKYSNIINAKNKHQLYKIAVDCLLKIQKKPKFLGLRNYSLNMLTDESFLFVKWYLKLKKNKNNNLIFKDFNNILSEILKIPLKLKNVNVHRDYHIDNLFYFPKLVNTNRCGLIDHQDAVFGTCVYDLMSLLEDARIDPNYSMNDKIISYYLENFKEIDKFLFLRGYKIIAIQRHLKVLGIFSRLYLRDNKSNYLKHLPRVLMMLKKNLNEVKCKDLTKIILELLK